MGFKTQDGFQFTGSSVGLKYVSGKRISFYISEQGDPGVEDTTYNGTSGIVSTNIVLDLNATISSSYSGSGTTWSNLASSSYDATLFNGVGFSSDFGGTLVFDGTNDYASISNAAGLGGFSGDFTIEFWFKSSDMDSNDVILEHATGLRWAIQVHTDEQNMYWRRDSNIKLTTSGANAFDDAWHHHVVSKMVVQLLIILILLV